MRRNARRLAGVLAAAATVYAALPYVTLYRLGVAIRDGDAASLEKLVDWDTVREGIKEDLADAMADQPAVAAASADGSPGLPAFGASFMHGIAVNMIDQAVTAPALVDATHVRRDPGLVPARPGAEADADQQPRITWAFFDGPASFDVELLPPGAGAQPIRIELALNHGAWRVVRAWMPPEMMTPQADRT